MALALRLAERGRGQVSPNPMVGAVLVDAQGVIVGLGYHEKAGGPHAEIQALRMAGARSRQATLYCTLEPCSHTGRTGPCCVALAEAGVRRVVVAAEDPNPLVAGRGLAYLRAQGLEVREGLLCEAAEQQNVAFFTAMRKGRPWVVAKIATSLDGRVAAAPGQQTRLTSEPANRVVHRLRAEVDALAVGAGTLLADDPALTVRGVFRARPLVRVIFDTALRTPPSARVLATVSAGPVVIVTHEQDDAGWQARAGRLRAAGADLLGTAKHDLRGALEALARREIRSVLLEGGPTLHRSAFRERLVDRVQVFVTPAVLGARGVPWDMPPGLSLSALAGTRCLPLGSDVLLECDVHGTD